MSKKCFLLKCGPKYFQLDNPIAFSSAIFNLALKTAMCAGRSIGEARAGKSFSAASSCW